MTGCGGCGRQAGAECGRCGCHSLPFPLDLVIESLLVVCTAKYRVRCSSKTSVSVLACFPCSFDSFPHNFIPKVVFSKQAIHHKFEVVACGGVAVEIDCPCGFEDAVHFKQTDCHCHEIDFHGLVIDLCGRLDDLIKFLVAFRDLAMSFGFDVLVRPDVFEGGTFGS